MTTISDVAKAAGVSRSTVSHALSGKRTISEATRNRINEAIVELQYIANAGARALATRKSLIIGLIVPFTPEEFAPSTMQYVLVIAEAARSFGYDLLMVTEEEGAAGITRVTQSYLVDGIILLDVKRHDDRLAALGSANQPGVLLGTPDGDVNFDVVDLDFATAGEQLVRHLYDQGHRDFMFLTLPERIFEMYLGYAWCFRDSVMRMADELGMRLSIIVGDADPQRRSAAVAAALDERGTATALLVHNDGALVDLQQILEERSLKVPGDLAVVSLFPEQFGRMFSLPYTAIETSAVHIASEAVRLLVHRLENPDAPFVRALLPPVIIDRGTSYKV